MSCSIALTASISDVGAIRRCLFPTDDARGGEGWLQACAISVSPIGDIIAVAHERRLVVLSAKWDPQTKLSQFQIVYSGSIHDSDNVRAVACLPIISQSKSSHVVPDWTCILLGFDSGHLRFYTETCELLVEDQLHPEHITSIKCRSRHNPRPDIAPDLHPDEIYIQYQSAVCVIPGAQIFPLLRMCRADLARAQAASESLEPMQGEIAPKKWGFTDQATINDIAVVGINLHAQFDHLLMMSTCAGYDAKYRSQAPINSLVLAAGSRPFLGYHYALQGPAAPVFSDVAKAVATKLKSALPGWLMGTKTPLEKHMSVAMQPAETIGCRFGLCDLRRTATNVILSPNHRLAAVSDALGRVLLVDAFRGITIRIFKGYRDAQCAFIQVPDERHSKHRYGNKVALFLCIYSPKKGTLELFTVQQGHKITTFTAGKHSRLVYNNYGLMGFATTSKSKFVCQFDTLLIDNDGLIKEISVPFHFALSEKSSKRARDIHLFRKIKQVVKSDGIHDCSGIIEVCGELKTEEYKLQTLQFLLGTKTLESAILQNCVQVFLSEDDEELRLLASNAKNLLDYYEFSRDYDPKSDSLSELAEITISEKQLMNLQRLLDLNAEEDAKPSESRVGFAEPDIFPFSDFITCFNLTKTEQIEVNADVDENLMFRASEFIFAKFLVDPNLDIFENLIRTTKIPPKDLFCLLLYYWVNRPTIKLKLDGELKALYHLLATLTRLSKPEEVMCEYSETAPFWNTIRAMLANSAHPFPALTAAILCKTVSENLISSSGLEDDIEILSEEKIEWAVLIGRLEDVSLLNIVLTHKPVAISPKLAQLKWEKSDISLKYILDKGKGVVGELVGHWMTVAGLDPELLVLNDKILRKSQQLDDESTSTDSDEDVLPEQEIPASQIEAIKSEEAISKLNQLKTVFPYSLEAGMLLVNMCWEYALAWQKDRQNLEVLSASIRCLAQIPCSHVREGVSKLVWSTHLKQIFESAAKLINKVGKLPKERLCQQDTGLAEYQMTTLLAITTHCLDVYMDAVQKSFGQTRPRPEFEHIWQKSTTPLVEVALAQPAINYDLLHLHYQLSKVLQMMTKFAVKHSKPMHSLFESYMLGMFFQDFGSAGQINWNYADFRVQNSRTQFLSKVIVASLETVTVSDGGLHYTAEHAVWMEKVLDMGQLWNLDLEVLRTIEVVQAYNFGLDGLGDELFAGVGNRKQLGEELLKIAGRRLTHFFATSPNIAQNTCAFTPLVTRYIQQLEREWTAPSTLEATENVANRALSCMGGSSYDYKTAEYLLDGVRTLIKVYKTIAENDDDNNEKPVDNL